MTPVTHAMIQAAINMAERRDVCVRWHDMQLILEAALLRADPPKGKQLSVG